ncbi:MAG TPA: GTPase Era [Campylobacterales bacterium]|nr:GTPase Era [Campylobacterales bacterium]
MSTNTKCGFVAVIGKPNAGKSTLLNWLIGEKIMLVSHKANATRKRLKGILMHKEAQIVLIDTPGLQTGNKLLNEYMLGEAIKAVSDADLILFIADVRFAIKDYEEFLAICGGKPHILLVNKIDMQTHEKLLQTIEELNAHKDSFLELIPISATKENGKDEILDAAVKYLPDSPYLYDPELLTDQHIREIYKEIIREELFNGLSDEIPYESDVVINKIIESETIDKVYAVIIANKDSQKAMIIGKSGQTIKRIGTKARVALEKFSQKKIHLELLVKTNKNWTTDKKGLAEYGYDFES